MLIPNTVARVGGGPHPETAARLIEFLLSARAEQMIAESVSRNIPLGPERAPPDPATSSESNSRGSQKL